MNNKTVCFAGHRDSWRNIGIEEKLKSEIKALIDKGYTTFYDGNKGYFDEIALRILIELKKIYHEIKIIKVLSYYHENKEKWEISSIYDESVYPDLENCHPKQIITKRNEWIINNCDIVVCHIEEFYKSGAYKTIKYAKKINKPIIYI